MANTSYWDTRFRNEGMVWGAEPSRTAVYALEAFRKAGGRTVLVPGSGYGRNTRLFSQAGMKVTGVEISEYAVQLAKEHDPETIFHNASVIDMTDLDVIYDTIYCFNVLHLFGEADRTQFLSQCSDRLRNGGLAFFTVFSENEPTFGKGPETEPNTFESRPGRAVHYFTEDDLLARFEGFEALETGSMEDPENHGEGPHTHVLRYILVRKGL